MSFLDINPDEQDQILERLYSTPNVEAQPPGLITGRDVLEPFKGLAGSLTKVEALSQDVQSLATRPLYRGLDAILGTSIEEDNERQRQQIHDAIRYFAPDPERTGYAGRVLNGIFDVGPRAIAGFAAGGPLLAAAAAGGPAGYASFLEGKEVQHLDAATAAGKGAIEGVFTGAMTAIPASVGAKLLPNALLYGPAINIAQGILARGIVHEWLDMQGYHDVATQYKWLDAEGIAIDAVLGSAFGALGAKHWERPSKPLPSEIDAALTANEAQHIEIDTAPGLPVDLETRQQHTIAIEKAINDLLTDEPVEVPNMAGAASQATAASPAGSAVEPTVPAAQFILKPQDTQAAKVIAKALDEAGYGDVTAALAETEATAKRRGVELPPEVETVGGVAVRRIPVDKIDTAPNELQYKIGAGKEGAGLALNKAAKFNPKLAGVVTAMPKPGEPGRYLIVNGHQRLALAKRSGQTDVLGQILPAGTTMEEARATGARINISEGRGTAVDAAKFLRDTGTTPEQLANEGIDLSESMTADAVALRNLTDPLFRDITTGHMEASRGIVIGRELGDNEPAQTAIARTIRDLESKGQSVSNAKLTEMIRIAKGSESVVETQTDLFGSKELKKSLAPEQADILAYTREQLGRDKRLFGTVVRHKGRLEAGKTSVDVKTATGISSGAAARTATLDATAYSAGTEVNAVVRDYARRLSESPKGARAGVLQDAYAKIYDALEKDFGVELAGVRPEAGPDQGMMFSGGKPRIPGVLEQVGEVSRETTEPAGGGYEGEPASKELGKLSTAALEAEPKSEAVDKELARRQPKADADVAQAEKDSVAFQAAVDCFKKGGIS